MKYDEMFPDHPLDSPEWVENVGEVIKREDYGIQPCAVCQEPTRWIEPAAFDAPLCSPECSTTFWGDCGAGSIGRFECEDCDDVGF